jgi:hypothetical protein
MAEKAPVQDLARQDFLRRLIQATRHHQRVWDSEPLPLWGIPWSASCLHNGEVLFWLWPPDTQGQAGLAAMETYGPRWLATPADCPQDLLFDLEQAITTSWPA